MASLGAEVLGVPVDDQGLVVEAIPPRTRLVYVTPSHQFPLGMAMSLPRRLALLAWAERHDAAVVEDDYDSEFRYGGRPIEPLQTLDGSGRVIYVGSFSKTLLPTLRLGFLVVPASLVAAVRRAKFLADWHTPLPTQAALADFIDQGYFARHLRKMRATYQQRHQQIVESLDDRFADHLKPVPSAAGLHVAATAPASTPEELRAVLGRASAAGVEVQPLSMFDVGQPSQPGIVLGYGAIPHRRHRGGPEPAPALLRRLTRFCRPGLAWSTPAGIGSRSSPLSLLCSGATLHNLPRSWQGSPPCPPALDPWIRRRPR
jgi:GntR family transcriptional regulator/MocR family aminotransferase